MYKVLLALVWIYRMGISPFFPPACRFQPTCSEYAMEAIEKHGIFRGMWYTSRRILRCHPWGDSGYDPVPQRCSCSIKREERS